MRAENKPEAGLAEGVLFPAARENSGEKSFHRKNIDPYQMLTAQ
jgi:hypothetical protein